MVVFDLDVLKNDQGEMNKLLSLRTGDMILCYTNPAIELFILLSSPGSFESIIEPKKKEILNNEYAIGTKDRYIYSLVKEKIGLDTKDLSSDFRPILANVETAYQQENMFMNHLLSAAANTLTPNIAYVIQKIRDDRIDKINY